MKALVLSTIAFIVIAVISIILLVALISDQFKNSLIKLYCSISISAINILPIPESQKPPKPIFCFTTPQVYRQVVIERANPDAVAFEIASYSLACWKTTGEINIQNDRLCYELIIKRLNGPVTKDMVISNLPTNYQKIITWKSEIDQPKSIAIFYDSDTNLIEVS